MNDPIVNEVRRVREAHAAQFNYDLVAIFKDLKEQEKRSGRNFVSFNSRGNEPASSSKKQRKKGKRKKQRKS